MHPAITQKLKKLEQERSSLDERLRSYPLSRLNAAPAPGKWSPLQVVYHLYLSERLALKYMTFKWKEKEKVGFAGMKEKIRLRLLKLVLASPLKFKAPAPVAEIPKTLEYSLLSDWEVLRRETAEFLEKFDEENLNIRIFKHPFIGRIAILQTLDFYHAHFKHHETQILKQLT
jgi:hypothetical protein